MGNSRLDLTSIYEYQHYSLFPGGGCHSDIPERVCGASRGESVCVFHFLGIRHVQIVVGVFGRPSVSSFPPRFKLFFLKSLPRLLLLIYLLLLATKVLHKVMSLARVELYRLELPGLVKWHLVELVSDLQWFYFRPVETAEYFHTA